MPFAPRPSRLGLLLIASMTLLGPFAASARAQYGLALSGVGPINFSMGGAATAAPLDSAGALYWNPATITGVKNEMEVGIGFLVPRTTITSRVNAGALGFGQPTSLQSGNTGGNNGVFILPTFGMVYTPATTRGSPTGSGSSRSAGSG